MTTKKTSFGPVVITCRGAGSQGHDPHTVGAGKDVGLDIQIPLNQSANSFQISKPDGTVVFSIDSSGVPSARSATALASPATLPSTTGGDYIITAPAAATFPLPAPVSDGVAITVTAISPFAHRIDAGAGNLLTGTAANTAVVFSANPGSSVTLVSLNGKWIVRASQGVTFS